MFAHTLHRLFPWRLRSLRQRGRRSQKQPIASYRPRVRAFEERVVPSTTWIGGSLLANGASSGGDPSAWSNALNWSNGIPVVGETVIFTQNVIETYVDQNGNVSHHMGPQNGTSNVDLSFSVGTLTADSTWGGTINVNNSLSITNGLTLDSGVLGGSAALSIAGNSTWQQGVLVAGAGGITNTGTLTLADPVGPGDEAKPDRLVGLGTFFNQGTIIQSGSAGLDFVSSGSSPNGTTLDNEAGANYEITTDSGFTSQAPGGGEGGGTFINTGLLEKTATAIGTSVLAQINFDNTGGTIDVQAGILQLQPNSTGASTGGTFDVSTGAVLDLTGGNEGGVHYSGTYTGSGGGTVTVDYGPFDGGFGHLVVDSAGATFDFPAGMFQWNSGTIDLSSGNLTNSGSMSFSGGNFVGSGTFFNTGTIQGSGFNFGGPMTFDNEAGATYIAQAGTTWTGGQGSFINAGTLEQVGDPNAVSSMAPNPSNGTAFDNTGGTIDVQSGILRLASSAGANTGGTFDVSPGALLDLTGSDTVHYSGTYTGSGGGTISVNYGPIDGGGGTLAIDSAGATFDFPAGMFQWNGGTIDVTNGNLTNTGSMTFNGAGALSGGGTLFNAGTIEGTGLFFAGSTLDNEAGATYLAQAGTVWSGNGGNSTFLNAGTLETAGSPTGVTVMDNQENVTFENNGGTINVQDGALLIAPGFGGNPASFTGGTFDVATGAILDLTCGRQPTFTGSFTGSGGGVIDVGDSALDGRNGGGDLVIGAAGASFNFPKNLFQWTDADIDVSSGGTLTIAKGSFIQINTTDRTVNLWGAGTLLNKGTMTEAGGNSLVLQNNAMLDNAAGAKFTFLDDSTIGQNNGGTLTNAGTVSKTGGTGTSFIGSALNTTGTVSVTSGTLNVSGAVTQIASGTLTAGSWSVTGTKAPATLTISSASITTLGTKAKVTVSGSQGTFNNLSSLADILAGGSMTLTGGAALMTSGALTNNGLLTVNAGDILTIQGAFTESSTATLTVQLGGTNTAPSFGRIVSTGPVTLAGRLVLKETSSTLDYPAGTTLQFITNTGNGGTTGIFANSPDGATITLGKMTFTIHYAGGDGNDVTLST